MFLPLRHGLLIRNGPHMRVKISMILGFSSECLVTRKCQLEEVSTKEEVSVRNVVTIEPMALEECALL